MRSRYVPYFALMTLALAGSAHAEDAPAPTAPDVARELSELRANQDALQKRVTLAEERAAAATAAAQVPSKKSLVLSAAPGKGFTVELPDRFSLNLRSRAQIRDTIIAQGGKPTTNELNVKTVRLQLQGYVLTKDLQYALQLAFGGNDFETGSSSPIFDAYVEYTRLRDLNIRVGQFYVPFDRARTVRDFALQFPDRAQVVNELNLDRDVGIALSSQNLFNTRGILAYHLGFFGGEGKNRFGGTGVGFLYTLRFVVRPFGAFDDDVEGDLTRLRRPRLAIGFAGGFNHNSTRQRSTTGPTLVSQFDYGHAEADVVFKIAGVSFLGEVLYRQSRQGSFSVMVNNAPVTEWSRSGIGYVLQAGVMVHDKVELVARWDQLFAIQRDIGTDPALLALVKATGKEVGAGVNIYLNGHAFKIQPDYQYQFGDSVSGGRHTVRINLDATF